ncbi:MAG: ADP-ribosylation factor-like protein [Candidatus Sigynarchaeota archaeon]
MAKKIVFIGPASAGKTTLRKIFFEYQTSEQLLQYGLDPTYGIESLVLNLGQEIGVFDLAGQENSRWIETEEKEIFAGTSIIILVFDVSSPINNIFDFITKLVKVRDEISPEAMIFMLIHKIDLVSPSTLESIKQEISSKIEGIPLLKINYTSIKKEFFIDTLGVFLDIIKVVKSEEMMLEQVNHRLIKNIVKILSAFKKSKSVSEADLLRGTGLTVGELDMVLQTLQQKNTIDVRDQPPGRTITLKPDGFAEVIKIVSNLERETAASMKTKFLRNDILLDSRIPPVVGFILANKDGIVLMTGEVEDGAFRKYLNMKDKNDINLIAPFVSALHHFSREISIVNMADFKIKGQNMLIYVIDFKDFQVTMFANKDTEIEKLKDSIIVFFSKLFSTHGDAFINASNTGMMQHFVDLEIVARQWLVKLNKFYSDMILSMVVFDADHVKKIYDELEDISFRLDKKNTRAVEQVKRLKSRLVSAIMERNMADLKRIAVDAREIGVQINVNK